MDKKLRRKKEMDKPAENGSYSRWKAVVWRTSEMDTCLILEAQNTKADGLEAFLSQVKRTILRNALPAGRGEGLYLVTASLQGTSPEDFLLMASTCRWVTREDIDELLERIPPTAVSQEYANGVRVKKG